MRFFYKGVDHDGAKDNGTIDAADEFDAFSTLESRGIIVFELSDVATGAADHRPWYRRDIELFGSRLTLSQQASTAEMLSVLFKLGLPLTETLRLLEHGSDNPKVTRHFARTYQRVADGVPLPEAFADASSQFSPMFQILLRVSDAANTLPETMRELARYLRNQERVAAKLKGALVYPAVLILAAIGLILVIVFYLAPSLEPMFSAVDKPMPGSLAFFITLRDLLEEYGWLVLSASVGGAFAVLILLTGAHGEPIRHSIVGRLPVWGVLSRKAQLLRQIRALNMLLRSGMPFADALETVAEFLGTSGPDLLGAADALKQGGRAADVFGSDRALPPLVRDLIRIGEETNRLPDVLSSLAQTLEDQLEAETQRATQLITPILTLVLGLSIGILIYQVMGAILEINELAF